MAWKKMLAWFKKNGVSVSKQGTNKKAALGGFSYFRASNQSA
jgi:hypothetical protein